MLLWLRRFMDVPRIFFFFIPFCSTFCRRGAKNMGKFNSLPNCVWPVYKLSCLLFLPSWNCWPAITDWRREDPSSTSVQELCYKEYKLKISRNQLETDQTGDGCHCKLLPVYVVPFVTQKDGYGDGRRPLKGRIGIDNYYREIHLLFSLLQEATNKTSFSKWVLWGDKGVLSNYCTYEIKCSSLVVKFICKRCALALSSLCKHAAPLGMKWGGILAPFSLELTDRRTRKRPSLEIVFSTKYPE